MKQKLLLIALLSIVLISSIASALTIKYTPAPSPRDFGAFWDIGFIVIYDVDNLTDEELNELLVHEYTHQLCWDLFDIYPKDIYDHSPRCFTGGGSLLID